MKALFVIVIIAVAAILLANHYGITQDVVDVADKAASTTTGVIDNAVKSLK